MRQSPPRQSECMRVNRLQPREIPLDSCTGIGLFFAPRVKTAAYDSKISANGTAISGFTVRSTPSVTSRISCRV